MLSSTVLVCTSRIHHSDVLHSLHAFSRLYCYRQPSALFFTFVEDATAELLKASFARIGIANMTQVLNELGVIFCGCCTFFWQCNEGREADDLLSVLPFPLGEAFRLMLEARPRLS